jgi:small subunit ribosomal protein S16
MAVKIRLARFGDKKRPYYRVVVAHNRAPRDGRFLAILGTYDPRNKQNGINIDVDAIKKWVDKGAQATEPVLKLMNTVAAPTAPQE